MDEKRILIVDDDENICSLLKLYLENAGFATQTCLSGRSATAQLDSGVFDLILLDVMLPDITGFDLCRTIKETIGLPVILITARDMLNDKIQGFNFGADDYIIKPFEPAEVVARIKARLRSTENAGPGSVLVIGNVTVDLNAYEVRKNGRRVGLKPKEIQLLYFLLRNKNVVFSREMLLKRVWKYSYTGDTRTVDVHIRTLRQKLWEEDDGWDIKTVWGVGYKIEGD